MVKGAGCCLNLVLPEVSYCPLFAKCLLSGDVGGFLFIILHIIQYNVFVIYTVFSCMIACILIFYNFLVEYKEMRGGLNLFHSSLPSLTGT